MYYFMIYIDIIYWYIEIRISQKWSVADASSLIISDHMQWGEETSDSNWFIWMILEDWRGKCQYQITLYFTKGFWTIDGLGMTDFKCLYTGSAVLQTPHQWDSVLLLTQQAKLPCFISMLLSSPLAECHFVSFTSSSTNAIALNCTSEDVEGAD